MSKLNLKRFICLLLCVLTFALVGNEKQNVSMEQKLKTLNYSFDSSIEGIFVIKGNNNKIVITKEPQRDPETNKVSYLVLTLWEPCFLDESEIKNLLSKNKDMKFGKYDVLASGNRVMILFGFELPKNVSNQDLSKAIKACATATIPINIDIYKQHRLSIIEVLNEDQKAGKSGKSEKEIARMMSRINLSYCPTDFQAAYKKHTAAWAQNRRVATEIGTLIGAASEDPLTTIICTIGGAIVDTAVKGSDIEETFMKVLKIARSYGVDTRPYE